MKLCVLAMRNDTVSSLFAHPSGSSRALDHPGCLICLARASNDVSGWLPGLFVELSRVAERTLACGYLYRRFYAHALISSWADLGMFDVMCFSGTGAAERRARQRGIRTPGDG